MPDGRLQRTRDVYPSDQFPTLEQVYDALPRLPPRRCRLVVNPRTHQIERVYEPERFVPRDWNVIEGDH
jgi:hypothetical protein